MLPVFDKENSTTRDKIISILAMEPSQNTKKINAVLKKQYALNVTYQAIHKTLKQMVEQGVLEFDGKSYKINSKWVEELKMFVEKSSNFTIKSSESRSQGEISVIEVNSLKEVDKFWLGFEKSILKEFETLPEKERIAYLYLPHCWFALSYPQNEHEFMRDLKKIKGKIYYFCSGDTLVDRWVKEFYSNYPDSPYKIFLGVKSESTSEKWISSNKVTDVFFPSGFLKIYDELYSKTKDIMHIQLGQFLDEVYKIREPIQIVENTNINVIKNIQKISLKRAEKLLYMEGNNYGTELEKKSFLEYWDAINSSEKTLDLGMGMPDPKIFPIPKKIREKLHQSIDDNRFIEYIRQEGNLSCINELKEYENKRQKNDAYTSKNFFFTPGAIMAYSLLLNLLIEEGDEIILWRPSYFSQVYASKRKAKVVMIDSKDFEIKAKDLVANLTDKTKIITITQPNNPTGKFISQNELKNIIEIAKEKNIYVIIDESCDSYRFNEYSFPQEISAKNVIRIKGFSKLENLSGYRLGYIIADKDILANLKTEVPAVYGNATVMMYDALEYDLKVRNKKIVDKEYNKVYETNKTYLENNLKYILESFKKSKNIEKVIVPDACYYIFFKLKRKTDVHTTFRELLKSKQINILPGTIFGMPETENWFRMCFARDFETLKKGIKRILELK